MSMHIEGPWLSTTGRKKGKVKYKSAEAKRQAEALDASWQELKKKHSSTATLIKKVSLSSTYGKLPSLAIPEGRNTTAHIKSLRTDGGSASLAAPKVYTGTKVKGIATMHKSNAVPVFSDEEAIEISKMRRG
jgi:hypothetical protein